MEPNFRESPELGTPFSPEARKEAGGLGVAVPKRTEIPGSDEIERERARVAEAGTVHHEVHEKHPLPVEIPEEHRARELEKIIASGGVEINPNKEGKHPADVTDQLIEIKDWTK